MWSNPCGVRRPSAPGPLTCTAPALLGRVRKCDRTGSRQRGQSVPVLLILASFLSRGDLTEDNMDTENAAAAAAAAFTASSQLKEAVLGREPAGSTG